MRGRRGVLELPQRDAQRKGLPRYLPPLREIAAQFALLPAQRTIRPRTAANNA